MCVKVWYYCNDIIVIVVTISNLPDGYMHNYFIFYIVTTVFNLSLLLCCCTLVWLHSVPCWLQYPVLFKSLVEIQCYKNNRRLQPPCVCLIILSLENGWILFKLINFVLSQIFCSSSCNWALKVYLIADEIHSTISVWRSIWGQHHFLQESSQPSLDLLQDSNQWMKLLLFVNAIDFHSY